MSGLTTKEREMLEQTHAAMQTVEAFVKAHHKTLHGNGQPGLIREVTELKATSKIKGILIVTGISFLGMLGTWAGVLYVILNQKP
jgi:hypothetical protein